MCTDRSRIGDGLLVSQELEWKRMTPEAAIVSPRRSKLRPPRLANDLVSRPRLLERLDRLATVSLIVAPAGYGKTTLVSMWLAQSDRPSAWVSLDEEDNEPSYF